MTSSTQKFILQKLDFSNPREGLRYKNGQWLWEDGHILSYSNWAVDQPKIENQQDACVIMNSDGKWETKDCFFEFASYFCKLETTDTPSSGSFNCDPGWMSFGEFCYFQHDDIKVYI